ncbi:MAG: molybdopterin-binding protein [Nitrospirae bacterium]|nr:molybdopterin-binding protein [Nitrospirota bacterium]MBF0534013.1 molybdopterin-binding protein [Nitrospirota bacterium]MBF0616172.1 molybdopterin-binding protein [Nitrospirota bacterium]
MSVDNDCITVARKGFTILPVQMSEGCVLAHDITEIRPGEFKGRAFKKGHVITKSDIEHLQRLGKDNIYLLKIADDELHEDDAAHALASAIMGNPAETGVIPSGEPKEGKIDFIADRDGLLVIDKDALTRFNMTEDVMCATIHSNTVVKTGVKLGGVRAIPLVIKRTNVERAVAEAKTAQNGAVLRVKEIRRPRAGVVITGNEVFYGRIKDAFLPVVERKLAAFGGKIFEHFYAPDDVDYIYEKLMYLLGRGADLLITTGGMSVDPDDVTPIAVKKLPVNLYNYGTSVLPGAMFLVAYIDGAKYRMLGGKDIPVMCMPGCGMYNKITVFDLLLPRVLAGELIDRRKLAEMAHGGFCLSCPQCTYPVCPFGK